MIPSHRLLKQFLSDVPESFLEKYTLQDVMNLIAAGRTYAIWAISGHSVGSATEENTIARGRAEEMNQMVQDFTNG